MEKDRTAELIIYNKWHRKRTSDNKSELIKLADDEEHIKNEDPCLQMKLDPHELHHLQDEEGKKDKEIQIN